MYILRLDDASEYSNIDNWVKMEKLLDTHKIKPIVGIIPCNKDKSMVDIYKKDNHFWDRAIGWERKGWIIAMHGYEHLYNTAEGGINPVHNRSEFAGLSFEKQCKMLETGYKFIKSKGLEPRVFFAPSHTFDDNTVRALKETTDIKIISDTIAYDKYINKDILFIPQQSGKVRNLPFKTVTFCYHPNTMSDNDFIELEKFIVNNKEKFSNLDLNKKISRTKKIIDVILEKIYFIRRK